VQAVSVVPGDGDRAGEGGLVLPQPAATSATTAVTSAARHPVRCLRSRGPDAVRANRQLAMVTTSLT